MLHMCCCLSCVQTERVAGVHKLNSILLSRLGNSIAELPPSLSTDRGELGCEAGCW